MLIYFEYADPIVSKKVGKVAIRCPLCERPRVHTVIERFKAQTFFFWQLGARGPAIETVAKCKNCRHESFFSRGDFEDIVPLDEEIYLDELLAIRNCATIVPHLECMATCRLVTAKKPVRRA